jgi:signal transduction histidine kinase
MQFRFQVLNIAANDLKNPLVAVVNFGELLNEPDMTPSEREVITGQASGMAERALGLINALLEAHQLDVGQVRAHIGIVSLLPILHKTVERYRLLAKHKSIIIFNEYPLPTQAEIFVQADETMTRQVLENIISNAVKFTDFNRSVIIRILQGETDSFVEKELPNNREELTQNARKQSPKRIRIEVQDEGPGISPEDMKRMFGMFTRLSARPTGGESSTGVGLSIVKRMVETMNGRVWCESQIGSGTTFVIELPSAEK